MNLSYQNSNVSSDDRKKAAELIVDYVKHIQEVAQKGGYEEAEASINLPVDTELLQKVMAMKQQKVTANLKYIVDIGIGGSNLGTKAIYDAFYGYFDMFEPDRFPKMIFLDTNDPEFLAKFVIFIEKYVSSPDEILVNAISKSGSTTETISNLEITFQALEKKFQNTSERLVITTDFGSKLWEKAQEKKVAALELPKQVGGRYSVLSAVGLFPLAALGLDVKALQQGALQMREKCLNTSVEENPALASAVNLYLQAKHGKTINDNFFFQPELESVGKWYRQLMGESIGKEHDLQGNTVHAGITPTVSIGSTDLHSVGQLYFGGPQDKMTTFVWTKTNKQDATVPTTLQYPLIDIIAGKKASTIMAAICEGVRVAYKNAGMPYQEVELEDISENSLGQYLQFKMIEMMYLGKLFNVNTFDQPHVELYKVEMKKILSGT